MVNYELIFRAEKLNSQGVIGIHPLTFKTSRFLWNKSKPAGNILCQILWEAECRLSGGGINHTPSYGFSNVYTQPMMRTSSSAARPMGELCIPLPMHTGVKTAMYAFNPRMNFTRFSFFCPSFSLFFFSILCPFLAFFTPFFHSFAGKNRAFFMKKSQVNSLKN